MNLDELQTLVDQGEGQPLDFKRGVPSSRDLAEMVICFANVLRPLRCFRKAHERLVED